MRYEDASGSFSSAAAGTPDARDDADALAPGSHGPATGNTITGAGTITGSAGADVIGEAPGHIVAVQGAGGADSSDSGASLHVAGRFGSLTMDENGNYSYRPNGPAPENARDVFRYTLADHSGARDTATLTIEVPGKPIKVDANAQQIVPGPDGVVTLPPGVELSDVHVVGRNLVIDMPDGTQMIIIDGAVFVPQLVLGGVEVPATNLAALLIDTEPQPAGGIPQSSGGNFDVPVPPLDPGIPLGDLIPPTELVFTPPEFHEVNDFIDKKPDAGTISVQLDDDALAGGNPGGVGDDADSVNATGQFLPGSGGDGALTWGLLTSGAPSGFNYIDGPNGSILVQQVQGGSTVTVLTITVDPTDGSYTVVQNAAILHASGDNENNALFTINYTVTDQDGDTAAGTLNINVDDDTPTVSVAAGSDAEVSLTTHDAATIGAASEAVSTSANFGGVFSGTTTSPGADGAGSGTTDGYALSTTGGASGLFSHGVAINLYNVSGVIVGSTATTAAGVDASNTVFSVSTDNSGVVTLTQFSQIDHTADPHPTGAPFTDDIMSLTDGSITLTRNVTVVDRDGDSVTGSASVGIGANLHFVDDGPSIGLADRGAPSLIVDETNLAANDTQSFAANFNASFGADGPAAAGSITYALGINAGATGLIDVASGQAIVLVQNGAVVEGHVGSAAGALSFTVSVDAAGNVTLDQILALQHPDGTNADDSVTLANDNLVTLTATAHDFDGDTASSTLNIGQNLNFHDDGPSIQLSGSEASLTVDETILTTNDTQAFAGAFTSAFGADGAGTVTYDLNVLSPGANSGLVDSATGQPIVLVKNGAVVEGHVGNAAGALSFAVSVDTLGNVTLNQILALQHPNPLNPDDSVTLSADNLVSLTATVTDKDGDSESATLNIGQNLNFEDDGPHANNDSDTIASGGTTATGNVITGVGTTEGVGNADSAGADQPGHITAIQGTAGTDTTFSGGVLAIGGSYGSLNIDADGNYTYNRAPGSPGGVDDVFTYTLTDADGDSTTATLTIHIGDATPHTDPNPPVGLDDDALAGGNAGGVGDDPNSVNATGTLSGAGGDGALTFAVQTTGAPSGFSYVSGGAGIVLVQQGGVTVLTVTVNASTGAYSVVQNAPIDHAAGGDENNAGFTINYTVTDVDGDSAPGTLNVSVDDDTPLAFNDTDLTNPATDTAVGNVITGVGTIEGAANADKPGADGFSAISNLAGFNGSSDNDPTGGFSVNGQFGTLQMDANGNYTYTRTPGTPGGAVDTFTYTYLDGDGDPATATLTITIADNTPIAGNVNVGLDDDALAGGNPGGTGDDPDSVNATGTLPGSGGDAPLTFGVLLTGAPAGFSYVSGGAGVVLVQQGGVTVLTVTVNNTTGAYSVVQNAPINHAAGGDENNQAFTINYTVTDSDTDVANGTISISVDDDTPTVSANAGVQLDDDALAGGNAGGVGDDANATNTTGTLAHSYGADGAGSVAYLTTGAPAGFSYALQGSGDLWVMQGATHVLTLTVNSSTGAYTVTQVAPIDHPAGLDENNVAFTINYQVTDHDGDSATGSIVVNVDDDTPTVSANAAVQLDDDALAGGNAGGIGDDANATNTTGTLAHSYGADGAGSVAYLTTGAPVGFSYALQGSGDLWVMQGATHVLTLTVNSSTGAYTVTQVAPIDHPAGLDENNVAFTINYQVTDHDGDSATGSIVVNVDDDTPTVSANAGVQLDDDALAGGNAGGVGDDANATNTTGTLAHSYGADGAGSVAYLTTGAPAGFSYSLQGNGDLWVMQGATHVLTLTVNSSTGAYAVTQVAPIDHPAGLDENNVSFTISYNVTDHDGDSATGSIVVNVDDDTPTVSANADVQLDDDALAGGNAGGVGDDANATNTSGTLAHSYGADGAGSVAYLNSGAPVGFSYALQGNGDLWVMQGATHVLTLTVNSSTGAYVVSQVAPISHPAGGDENNVSFTIGYQVTDHDGDTANGSIVVNVDDDTPTATINLVAGQNVSVDESVGIQADSNDTTNAGVIALFSGVATPGTDTDLPQYATNANAIVTSAGSSVGADGPGTTGFSLNVSSAGVDSGLNTTDGHDILLFKEGNLVVGRVSGGADDGKAAFAIAIDNTGHISTVEYLSIQHPDATNPDDVQSIANGAVTATVTVTDADGDSVNSTPVGIGSHIQFQDSGPIMTSASNINIQNSGDVAYTGAFAFNLGADGAPTSNDVISIGASSATVNGVAVTNYVLTPGVEDATTASYTFSFDYPNGTGTTAHETGTLVFDKGAGTYTVDLADPISGFSILATAGAPASAFVNYNLGTSTTSSGPSEVAVVQLDTNFYLQFSGVYDKTGGDHLSTTAGTAGSYSPVTSATFGNLDLFSQANATVTVSSSAAGVAGNTIQGGEVLDFNLYTTNHTGVLGAPPDQHASSMFIELDGVGGSEDMIIILKLYDTVTHQYTEQALMVQNPDIIVSNAVLTGTPYAGIVLDSNDGLIVIEANDYQNGNTNLVIVGAQIAGSDDGVTGTALNFNGALGALGGSSGSQAFSTDVSDAPFKIQNIGFALVTTQNQNAHLSFDVTIHDGDGDTVTQTITADVTQAVDSSTPISLGAGVTTVSQVPLVTKSVATSDVYHSLQEPTTSNNSVLLGAIAAAGLDASSAVAAHAYAPVGDHLGFDANSISADSGAAQSLSAANDDSSRNALSGETQEAVDVQSQASSPALHAQEVVQNALTAGGESHAQAPTALLAATEASDQSAPAQSSFTSGGVAMPSAAMLAAINAAANTNDNALEGQAKHTGDVQRVLVDALAGGGHGPNIDAVIDAVANQGHGGQAAIAALASHGGAAVSGWDMGNSAGFTADHAALTMEHVMALHASAVPPAA